MFKKSENPNYFCLYKKYERKIALVELNRVEKSDWLITRLFVPPNYRNQGIATILMQELTTWADKKKATLIAEVNPYGDLGREKLIQFLFNFNFKQVEQENDILFIRKFKGG